MFSRKAERLTIGLQPTADSALRKGVEMERWLPEDRHDHTVSESLECSPFIQN